MLRSPLLPLSLLALCALLLAPLAAAEEPAKGDIQRIASDEEAAAALEVFHKDFKARGLSGEEKLSQRDWAMSQLARLQHPDIVEALAKITKSSDDTLRVLAVIYLGEQTELPGLVGPHVLKALKRGSKDPVMVLSALQSLGNVRYLGATEVLAQHLEHRDFAVKKAAIQAIGQIGEMRLWKEVLRLAGVAVKTGDDVSGGTDQDSNNKEEVVEEGYSYDGVEVTYDTGAADDSDQKMAEKIGKEKLAANKAKAQAAAGAKGSTGGGGASIGSGATGKGGVARDPKELLPFVLKTLWQLTGERFQNSKEVAEWVKAHREDIRERVKLLDALEKAQKEEAKELK